MISDSSVELDVVHPAVEINLSEPIVPQYGPILAVVFKTIFAAGSAAISDNHYTMTIGNIWRQGQREKNITI